MEPWEAWIRSTWLSLTIRQEGWLWPIFESVHFIGLTMLLGTIVAFDLRVLGVARVIPLAALHRLLPWGVAGFGLCVLTGIMFFFGFPDQYAYNSAFHFKLAFLAVAGLNVAAFYGLEFRQVAGVGAGIDAGSRNKAIATVSLIAWAGVLVCGRLLTFFRPPFLH
jgi:hypothetical protein